MLWMAVNLWILFLLLFFPVLLRTFRLVPSGMDTRIQTTESYVEATWLTITLLRIYRPSKPATQSGAWHSHHWRMDWDILQRGHRWENPLIGWQSSADGMQGTNLNFKTKEDAIRFAQKQGYEFFVQEPNERRFAPKSYANNFVHSPGKLKHIKTK